ncbi:hypothetical protein BP5796_02328 [Coleophoma crateriformis]|uniref:DDHD domain-containing protein n=1 Tax=Coleophoma crateriformis TaxID=565419 RepID=A0A3D8SXX6_9HELO|nr:hypothetical protein BP5796_02328 [Coleophoma crateriformis]
MEPSGKTEKPEKSERSYLSAAVESISPWASSRSSTPKPASAGLPGEASGLKNQQGGDHTFNHWHNFIHRKSYPPDCPPLNARWFYAVDVPKRKPKLLKTNPEASDKPKPVPKKFVTFSTNDSRAIETAYQKLANEYEDERRGSSRVSEHDSGAEGAPRSDSAGNTSIEEAGNKENAGGRVRVPVHEDFLFDVDLENRELCPVYWLGPIYEVRRGSWFYQEGSSLRPCEENLAAQLEEGYLKVKPFRYGKGKEKQSSLAMSGAFNSHKRSSNASSAEATPRVSMEDIRPPVEQSPSNATFGVKDSMAQPPQQPEAYRLFGSYMNSIVTYQDSTVAWLSADSIMSRVSSTVYQKFTGGGYLSGVKLVRGYSEPGKTRESATGAERPRTPTSANFVGVNTSAALQVDERQQKLLKRRSAPPTTPSQVGLKDDKLDREGINSEEKNPLYSMTKGDSSDEEEEAARKREEKEIQDDYNDQEGEQSREVDHLILVTHGIGQRLGMRVEAVNFVHDINVLRQTLKSVYGNSADLQALNNEIDKLPRNCRVQVLPVCWRHLLDFPRQGVRQNRKEHDLGDAFAEEEEYPSLADITVDGVPFVRSLITDLALDILLYQSAYREHISNIVLAESNRIYQLFCERNPEFLSRGGKVSLVGHSLGSAILFDILCRQPEDAPKKQLSTRKSKTQRTAPSIKPLGKDASFRFDTPSFFCLGSPIGLFQMLKGRTISARHQLESLPTESPMNPDYMQDPFQSAAQGVSNTTGLPVTISSPKCEQLYNVFYPTDPISYRLEPLISSVYGSIKPQPLPYTKTYFGTAAGQGLTGIGAKVGQSVSGLWTSLSSGIASSLLNRSLGLTQADIASMGGPSHTPPAVQSVGAGTNITSGGVISDLPPLARANTNEKKRQLAEDTAAADRDGRNIAPTLIDNEIETLFAGFQEGQKNHPENGPGHRAEAEERGKKLRREEMKVRALNHTGRVDFQIQE